MKKYLVNCQIVSSVTPAPDTKSHRRFQPPFGEDVYSGDGADDGDKVAADVEMLMMHLLETEVEAVCALGRDLNKGEILFK